MLRVHRLCHVVLPAMTGVLLSARPALAADPTATPPILIDPLDPRAGEGASLVGAPLLALLVVVGLGLLAAATTLAYVRLVYRR